MTNQDKTLETAWLRPVRRTDLTVHELDGEALFYDASTADTHRLNSTAYFIWRHCDGRHGVEGIARRLVDAYDISAEWAREHVERALRELRELHLVLPSCEDEFGAVAVDVDTA